MTLAAYATAAEYRARNGRVSTADDATLNALLTSVSRVFDRRSGVAPGMWGPLVASANPLVTYVYTFTAQGGDLLRLRDERGEQYFLRGVEADGIGIDSERDGTFDGYTLDLNDAWVRGYPINAAAFGEPYTALRIASGVSGAAPTSWTAGVEVQITGSLWGWATTPGAIKDRVIGITRELVQVHFGGPEVDIESAIEGNSGARSLMRLLEQEYSQRLPVAW